MELDDTSTTSTPPEKEPVMECSLMLTTLSGETFHVSLSVAKFDRFEDLEDQVMDYLVSVTGEAHFGDPGLHSAFQPRFWGRQIHGRNCCSSPYDLETAAG